MFALERHITEELAEGKFYAKLAKNLVSNTHFDPGF